MLVPPVSLPPVLPELPLAVFPTRALDRRVEMSFGPTPRAMRMAKAWANMSPSGRLVSCASSEETVTIPVLYVDGFLLPPT
jgi:hypothetical protein